MLEVCHQLYLAVHEVMNQHEWEVSLPCETSRSTGYQYCEILPTTWGSLGYTQESSHMCCCPQQDILLLWHGITWWLWLLGGIVPREETGLVDTLSCLQRGDWQSDAWNLGGLSPERTLDQSMPGWVLHLQSTPYCWQWSRFWYGWAVSTCPGWCGLSIHLN